MGSHLHVRPRLRPIGRMLLRDWLAITIGSHIWAWRRLGPRELAHEMAHVRQWRRYGAGFAARYVAASLRSRMDGNGWYRGNRFEIEARAAAAESGTGPRAASG